MVWHHPYIEVFHVLLDISIVMILTIILQLMIDIFVGIIVLSFNPKAAQLVLKVLTIDSIC